MRRFTVVFRLSDSSVEIIEPKIINSGTPSGCFLSRTNKMTNAATGAPYAPVDFAVGSKLVICGRTFHVVECDAATRGFLTEQYPDLRMPDQALAYPEDVQVEGKTAEFGGTRLVLERPQKAKDDSEDAPGQQQFLDNDGKILLFRGKWDDTNRLAGEMRHFELRYFLSDDSLSIGEIKTTNSGRDRVNDTCVCMRVYACVCMRACVCVRVYVCVIAKVCRAAAGDSASM